MPVKVKLEAWSLLTSTRTFLKNSDSEPFLRGLFARGGGGLATADWTARVPVRVWADSG